MQLRVARLCLDCDEVHDQQTCPVCGSESFGYISRWIPAPERRSRPRPVTTSPTATVYRQILTPEQPDRSRWLRRGVLGLTAVSVLGWVWSRTSAEAPDNEGAVKRTKIAKPKEGPFVR